ncbi:uncharacterized protein LOC119988639 isoform X2 [Tripterygium wilfordii]|uniref:uncharacterized protein LOC119988639 isoform X2 n=1 Tax=Tripterygium wilfordii TaxID=458696 RepID=UPI0018F83DA6|nr:uncharacterized protein LOC119988639 isoform X2 [Tripterygium wilfordii]
MTLRSNPPLSEGIVFENCRNDVPDRIRKEDGKENEEEDEEEDVDFNPFLKETASPEASSSLSSEIEGLDGNVVGSNANLNPWNPAGEVDRRDAADSEHGEEEVVMQTADSPEAGRENSSNPGKMNTRKSVSLSHAEVEASSQENDADDVMVNDLGETNVTDTEGKLMTVHSDDEDAICKRTRARYSLVSITLDELEAFLQETDDEDDFQNVDDQEEYRKFLAAVLLVKDGDGTSSHENETVDDDEDEDNDADFEIELEEALGSDVDEGPSNKAQKEESERKGRRPETRLNRWQKASAPHKRKFLGQEKRPLRPLIPVPPSGSVAPFPSLNGRILMHETTPTSLASTGENGCINGFTPHQLGQLHCLIYEHVQLLIQIFSLCALDPSRKIIASHLQGLMLEMLQKLDEVMACKSVPYPSICFRPQYMFSSVPNEVTKIYPAQCTFESSHLGVRSSTNIQRPASQNISPSEGRNDYFHNGQTVESSFWVPTVRGPILSILEVAPLNLVGRYMDDVYTAAQKNRQLYMKSSCDTRLEKEPLFNLPCLSSSAYYKRSSDSPTANGVPPTLGQQPLRKTLAASIVESAKKQSIAFVPKEIAKLAQRFFPLFNPALYPHKPPPASVANRVLFTDAEDELLALGMMEYNTDWKAIQQRFLPCKSKHQKNRCASKAPENPIKAVRRMKTSLLTAEEIERIQEGLKLFKLDWMSVWKFVVPYRDPSLLPRQWRIARGAQRSYKLDAAGKEKRRLYESKRRISKPAKLALWQQSSDIEDNSIENAVGEHNSGNACVEEAYLHEAFLADWRPGGSSLSSSGHPCSNFANRNLPGDRVSGDTSCVSEDLNNHGFAEAQPHNHNMHKFPSSSKYPLHTSSHPAHVRYFPSNIMRQNHMVSNVSLDKPKSPIHMRPYRTRNIKGAHLVKLAPDLPPVNLPPSVRVISQSAFKGNQFAASAKVSASGADSNSAGLQNAVSLSHHAKSATINSVTPDGDRNSTVKDIVTNSLPRKPGVVTDERVLEERGNISDLQMHPLLFQAPEVGRLPDYSLACGARTTSSFGFFSGNQPQLNLNLFHSPFQAIHGATCSKDYLKTKEYTSAAGGIDFHPLLQAADDENSDLVTTMSNVHQSVCFEGTTVQRQNPSDTVKIKPSVHEGAFRANCKHSSPNEKANELDLEIYLSFKSGKEQRRRSGNVVAKKRKMSPISASDSGNSLETQKTGSSQDQWQCIENCSTVQRDSVPHVQASAIASNNISRCNRDDVGDSSHPGIVMEQEELSDSDEEMDGNVEFECEEMADSDGEEASGCDGIAKLPDKGEPKFTAARVAMDVNYDDQECELEGPVYSQRNNSLLIKSSPSLKLSLTSLGMDPTKNAWLSLESGAPGHHECKHENMIREGSHAKNFTGLSNRSCTKTTEGTNNDGTQNHSEDMTQQLSLGPIVFPSLRKPRKRSRRTNASLSMEMTLESTQNDQLNKAS